MPGDVDEQGAGDRLPGGDDDDRQPGQSGLARMLSLSHAMPERCPSAGSELENRKLKT